MLNGCSNKLTGDAPIAVRSMPNFGAAGGQMLLTLGQCSVPISQCVVSPRLC